VLDIVTPEKLNLLLSNWPTTTNRTHDRTVGYFSGVGFIHFAFDVRGLQNRGPFFELIGSIVGFFLLAVDESVMPFGFNSAQHFRDFERDFVVTARDRCGVLLLKPIG
jgi:hypothetical protein